MYSINFSARSGDMLEERIFAQISEFDISLGTAIMVSFLSIYALIVNIIASILSSTTSRILLIFEV